MLRPSYTAFTLGEEGAGQTGDGEVQVRPLFASPRGARPAPRHRMGGSSEE
jgi:hypothetical protein